MTPEERDLIAHLLDRLGKSAGQPKDPEAEAMIREAVGRQPDAPYFLVQTVLIQDMALATAQSRIAELERRAATAAPPQPTSFLGGLLGRSPSPNAATGSGGPWGRPAASSAAPDQPPPAAQQAMPAMASGGSGFLRQAAATAAGIAGGALLFDGIRSLFGYHAGGILGNMPMQPGLSETVINNYYGDDPASAASQGPWGAPGGDVQSADYAPDAGGDGDQDPGTGQDFANDQDFGTDQDPGTDGDFGGSDNDLI